MKDKKNVCKIEAYEARCEKIKCFRDCDELAIPFLHEAMANMTDSVEEPRTVK